MSMASDNAPPPTGSASAPADHQTPPGPGRVLELVNARKVDAAIFVMRLATVLCSVLYMVPTFTPTAAANARLHYERALLAAASAGAFRLHQITAQSSFRLNEALNSLWMRDVTQFFIYALLFLYNSRRMALIIVPLLVFHLLEGLPYLREVLRALGITPRSPVHHGMRKLEECREMLLKMVAWIEILLVVILFAQCLFGGVTLIQLLLYYRYLALRYSTPHSYCRQAFCRLHAAVELVRNHPDCPEDLRCAVDRVVGFVRWLKPASAEEEDNSDQQQQQQ